MSPFSSHSKLSSLSETQKDQVAAWLLDENLSQQQTADRIKEAFGFQVNQSSVHRFWHRECVPRKLLRAAQTAQAVQFATRRVRADWQSANAQLLGQRIFEALADPNVNLKDVCALGAALEKTNVRGLHEKALKAKLTGEKRRFEQKERQIALDREKFEFSAVEAALKEAARIKAISADPALPSDEKREQLRRLLFPQAFADSPA